MTIHECGHQFWYLLVGTNEFEEAWLDEGFNNYHDEKAAQIALGPKGWGKRYFGVTRRAPGPRAPSRSWLPACGCAAGDSDLARPRSRARSTRWRGRPGPTAPPTPTP